MDRDIEGKECVLSDNEIRELIFKLTSPEPGDRRLAGVALEEIGEPAVPALLVHMKEGDPIGPSAVSAICGVGAPAIPYLIAAMEDRAYGTLGFAPSALSCIGFMDEDCAVTIADVLGRDNSYVREGVTFAFASMGENGKKCLGALRERAVVETDEDVKKFLEHALHELG